MRVVIVADSPESDPDAIIRYAAEADRLVVTDGAVRHIPEGVLPHTICGDFDSLQLADARQRFPFVDFVHLPDQNANDLEKALELVLSQGATDVVILSGLGGRPDQHFVTLLLLATFSRRVNVEVRHAGMSCRVLKSVGGEDLTFCIDLRRGDVVSVLPFTSPAVVTVQGVEWPLHREILTVGSRGISNRANGGEVVITVHEGAVFLSHSSLW